MRKEFGSTGNIEEGKGSMTDQEYEKELAELRILLRLMRKSIRKEEFAEHLRLLVSGAGGVN